MNPFIYTGLPTRVIFGRGKISEAASEAKRLGMKRPLVITTPHQSDSGQKLVVDTDGILFAGAAMHRPVTVTDKAMAILKAQGCDGTIALGGGSATGLGKAIALRTDLP